MKKHKFRGLGHKVTDHRKYKLIYLEWQDAHSNNGWLGVDKVKNFETELCIVKECGFVHTENGRELILFGQFCSYHSADEKNEPLVGLIQKIPKTWIRKRVELGEYELGEYEL